ncbi:hypothetical protein CLAIMM_13956 [Cladophialophora immunda]|nr:hypothetical protein CLAIMM_13956 [Cladophialophora immunda]
MVSWSIVTAMTGFIKNGASLIAIRLVLGMTESALFPSLNVYISLFWKREEMGKRVACILAANSLAGALGGIFATVVTRIDGVGGYEGWRWLYFVEGMLSFVVALSFFFLIPDSPAHCYFLDAEEKEIAKARMGGPNTDVFNWADVKAALSSPICWLSAGIELHADIYNFSVSAFLPTIVNGIGYTALQAQYMIIPVYLTGAISVFTVSWVSDRIQKRGQVMLVMGCFIMTAYAILLGSRNNQLSYAACYILLMGQSSIPGLNLAWISGNTQPYFKRATAITMVVMLGNSGGIVAGQIYRSTDSPRYPIGHGTALAACGTAWLGVWVMLWLLRRKNAQKDRLLAQGVPDTGKGDDALEFRYIL